MNYLIAFIILSLSIGGMIMLLRKKVVFVLSEVPQNKGFGIKNFVMPAWERLKQTQAFQNHSPERMLHKILSKTRVLALKMEHKTASWLEKLRNRAKGKNGSDDINGHVLQEKKTFAKGYWDKLKK